MIKKEFICDSTCPFYVELKQSFYTISLFCDRHKIKVNGTAAKNYNDIIGCYMMVDHITGLPI